MVSAPVKFERVPRQIAIIYGPASHFHTPRLRGVGKYDEVLGKCDSQG